MIFISFGIIGPTVVFLKMGVLLIHMLESVNTVASFITAYEESQYNRDSHFLSVMCSLFPKATF